MASNSIPSWLAFFVGIILIILNLNGGIGDRLETQSSFTQAEWNPPCQDNGTCTDLVKNSYCDGPPETEGICQCLPYHLQYSSKEDDCDSNEGGSPPSGRVSCLRYGFKPGDRCSFDVQCTRYMGNYSSCVEGACQCFDNATYILEQNRYAERYSEEITIPVCNLIATKLEDPCVEYYSEDPSAPNLLSAECKNLPHSKCLQDKCVCHTALPAVMSITEPKRCVIPAKRIGGNCNEDAAQCSLLNNTKCDDTLNTCQCEEGFVANERLNHCIDNFSALNENCSESAQCSVPNSWCEWDDLGTNLTTCQCATEYVQFNLTTCLPIRFDINQPCDDNIQCTTGLGHNSECKESSCQCKENTIFFNNQCHPVVLLGEVCINHDQCNSNSSVISDGAALSCTFYRMDDNNNTISTCQCPIATHKEYQGYCYQRTGFGKHCETTEQCLASAGPNTTFICEAESKTCGCPSEYRENSDMTGCIKESVALGETCQESEQCSKSKAGHYCNFETGKCDVKSSAPRVGAALIYILLPLSLSGLI